MDDIEEKCNVEYREGKCTSLTYRMKYYTSFRRKEK